MSAIVRKRATLDFVTLAVLGGLFALTAVYYPRLPDRMPTHFALDGRPNGWMPRAVGAWFLPALAVVLAALFRFGSRLMPAGWRARFEASPVQVMALILTAFLTGVHAVALREAVSPHPHLGGDIWVLVGLMFVVLGLVLPRARRNPLFGIRTAFALSSDENWARTQRVGGYAITIGGLVAVAAGLLGSSAMAVAAIIGSALVPTIWSWILAYRGTGDAPHA